MSTKQMKVHYGPDRTAVLCNIILSVYNDLKMSKDLDKVTCRKCLMSIEKIKREKVRK